MWRSVPCVSLCEVGAMAHGSSCDKHMVIAPICLIIQLKQHKGANDNLILWESALMTELHVYTCTCTWQKCILRTGWLSFLTSRPAWYTLYMYGCSQPRELCFNHVEWLSYMYIHVQKPNPQVLHNHAYVFNLWTQIFAGSKVKHIHV